MVQYQAMFIGKSLEPGNVPISDMEYTFIVPNELK